MQKLPPAISTAAGIQWIIIYTHRIHWTSKLNIWNSTDFFLNILYLMFIEQNENTKRVEVSRMLWEFLVSTKLIDPSKYS